MNTSFPFNRKKAAESAAEFTRLAGGRINLLKLTKLMYLLDRASLEAIGVPVVGGKYVSMKHGPVTSEVLDSINRTNGHGMGVWAKIISERDDECDVTSEGSECSHLSPYEINLIKSLHEEHKNRDRYELRDWCHNNCKEWVKPKIWQPGSIPIPVDKLAAEIHRSTTELEEALAEAEFLDSVFTVA